VPLNAVIGYSEMIQEEFEFLRDSNEPGAEVVTAFIPDLQRIRTAGKHLLALINDILDLSKIESGKMTVHVEMFDVPELLDDIESTIRPLAEANRNAVVVEAAEGLRFMRSDLTKVRQILLNLLSNASKFTSDGSILLRVDRDAAEQYIFSVADTGLGMSPEQLENIFDSFAQADSSTTREYGGTGLGLAISSRFCELLGGDIGVESTPGEGTVFTARLAADLQGGGFPKVPGSADKEAKQTEIAI
jgi:signal transduction histidine kinase